MVNYFLDFQPMWPRRLCCLNVTDRRTDGRLAVASRDKKTHYQLTVSISSQAEGVDIADGLKWAAVWKNRSVSDQYHSVSDWHLSSEKVDNDLNKKA